MKTLIFIAGAVALLLSALWWWQRGEARAPQSAGKVLLLPSVAMEGLDRSRTIRLYLPPDYERSGRRYPVIYMHDGQNLFDEATSYAGEWAVDETLDALSAQHRQGAFIVVGIDNGGEKRMNELSPWPNEQFGVAEGDAYLRFIVEQVKPMIDREYRTLADREHTAIIGSSMGGLISHYALCAYPEVFSKGGILSPSFWFAQSVWEHTASHAPAADARLYLLVGAQESEQMREGMLRMAEQLRQQGHAQEQLVSRVGEGGHNEGFWRQEFAAVVSFLFDLPTKVRE